MTLGVKPTGTERLVVSEEFLDFIFVCAYPVC